MNGNCVHTCRDDQHHDENGNCVNTCRQGQKHDENGNCVDIGPVCRPDTRPGWCKKNAERGNCHKRGPQKACFTSCQIDCVGAARRK